MIFKLYIYMYIFLSLRQFIKNKIVINNKDLLYSTMNYIEYLVINYNGKESKSM